MKEIAAADQGTPLSLPVRCKWIDSHISPTNLKNGSSNSSPCPFSKRSHSLIASATKASLAADTGSRKDGLSSISSFTTPSTIAPPTSALIFTQPSLASGPSSSTGWPRCKIPIRFAGATTGAERKFSASTSTNFLLIGASSPCVIRTSDFRVQTHKRVGVLCDSQILGQCVGQQNPESREPQRHLKFMSFDPSKLPG